MIVAQLRASVHQHRHQCAKTLLQRSVAIDIDHVHQESELFAQRRQRDEHLVAQVTVSAAIERKPQRRVLVTGAFQDRILTSRSSP